MISPGAATLQRPEYTQTQYGPIPNAVYSPINTAWTDYVNKINAQAAGFQDNPNVQNAQDKMNTFQGNVQSGLQTAQDKFTQAQADTQLKMQKAQDFARGAVASGIKKQNPAIFSQGF